MWRLKIWCNLCEGGKCLSISCKKSRPMFVLTFLLKGGLYHITFRCLVGLVELLLLSRFGSYVKSVLTKLLRFKASLYKGAASLNVASLHESLLIRLFIDVDSCRRIDGGWSEDWLM